MKLLLSLILLTNLPAFADSQCNYVDPVQQEWLIEQIANGKKNLLYMDLRGANLREADLTEADLTEADLRKAILTGADLTWATLTEADLRKAILTGADLWWADFTKANLSGAIIDSKYRDKIKYSGALNPDKIKWVD